MEEIRNTLPKMLEGPATGPVRKYKKGNNRYGNRGTIKCQQCRRRKIHCEYARDDEQCRSCRNLGTPCGEKSTARHSHALRHLHDRSFVAAHLKILETCHQKVAWVGQAAGSRHSSLVEDVERRQPGLLFTNSIDDEVGRMLESQFPSVDCTTISSAVGEAVKEFEIENGIERVLTGPSNQKHFWTGDLEIQARDPPTPFANANERNLELFIAQPLVIPQPDVTEYSDVQPTFSTEAYSRLSLHGRILR